MADTSSSTMPQLAVHVNGDTKSIDAKKALQGMQQLLDLLKDIQSGVQRERDVDQSETTWRVTDLQLGSVHAQFAPSHLDTDDDERVLQGSFSTLIRGFRMTEQGPEIPDDWSTTTVERAKKVATLLSSASSEGTDIGVFGDDGRSVRVTRKSVTHIASVVSRRRRSIGSVSGVLETLTVHRKFEGTLWTDKGNHRVVVRFNGEQLDEVRSGLNHRVRMHGILERNYRNEPVSLELREFQLLPDYGDGPKLSAAGGSIPDFTGGMTEPEYLRQIRGTP